MNSIKFIIIYSLIILLIFCSACNSSDSEISLSADVSFNNRSNIFIIENNNSFAWHNTELILNYEEDDISTGYKYKLGFMFPGGVVFLDDYEFISPDGKLFSTIREEVRILLIRAKTEDGRTGTFVKEW